MEDPAPRLARWIIILTPYNFTIEYRSVKVNCNADALSRLCKKEEGAEEEDEDEF